MTATYSVSNTATARTLREAPALQPAQVAETAPETAAEAARERRTDAAANRPAYQKPLFSSRELPQVVPFESIAPKAAERNRRPRAESPRPRVRQEDGRQRTLEFSTPDLDTDAAPEPSIYCDAPVAIPAHRVMAAAVDLSVIAIALGLFLGVFQLSLNLFHVTGVVTLSKQTLPFFIGIATVFGLLYKILWCLADGDSAGMRWAQLRLVNFDGQRPDREQRLYRVASGCVSFMAAGLGLMWALVDEETLTWHDHISKTFPTPE